MNLLGYVPKTNNKSYKGNMKGTVKNLLLKKHVDEEKHITREKLAAMTGIPIQTLADWEQHRHSPVRVNDLQNIAIALDCYLDDFVVDGKHI